ncbi:MAG: hypothetical protein Q9219_007270 [cf. Caloplaca sp. 3 TL-2023]
MSLDLLKEFGNPQDASTGQDPHGTGSIHEEDFGEFQQPEISSTGGTVGVSPNNGPRHETLFTKENGQQDGLLIDVRSALPPPSPSFRDLNAPLKLQIPPENDTTGCTEVKSSEATPITAWPSFERHRAKSIGKLPPLSPYLDDDEWGDFEEEIPAQYVIPQDAKDQPPVIQKALDENAASSSSLLDLMDSLEVKSSATAKSPARAKALNTEPAAPSNIPPPSILLSTVTKIFQSVSAEIRDIVSSAGTAVLTSVPSSHNLVFYSLASKITIIRASARILAGRKNRWRRDTHLAQSMKIGPANAGKAGGMKLAGVDRAETRREDQEAAEVMKLWKQQVGTLKSQIARINAQQSEIEFTLPEIGENTPIRTAKMGEGALVAPKCCFLCGLKRDERVAGLDVNVEDSFGEWWVDHWGHVDCIQFWEENRDSLKQR